MSEGLQISTQLQLIGLVVIIALVGGAIAAKFGFPTSVGYILSGLAIGPLGAGFIDQTSNIYAVFAELGLTLILFYLGLEMSLNRFRRTGAVAAVLAFVQMLFALVIGFFIAKAFGFGDLEAIIIASLLPMASTVMAVKFMMEKGILGTFESQVSLSVLIVEDFVGILVLVFLNSLSTQQSLNTSVLNGLLFIIAAYYVVDLLSKHILNILQSVGQEDKAAIYAIGVGVAVSFVGASLGLSNVLGAYFAGFALSESKFGERIKKEIGFFREFFILFFFVTFGASAVLPTTMESVALLAMLVIGYFLVMILSFGVMGMALGFHPNDAVKMGLAHAVIGEFSLIIAGSARELSEKGALAGQLAHINEIVSLAFTLTIVTSLVMPFLYANHEKIAKVLVSLYPAPARNAMSAIGTRMKQLHELEREKIFKTSQAHSLRGLVTNALIVIAIVYIASLKEAQTGAGWIPFIPNSVTLGMLLLPLVIWPLYRFVNELKIITRNFSEQAVERAFPSIKKTGEMEGRVADIFAGLVLSAAGFGMSIYSYYFFGPSVILLAPALYTIISLMYLSNSFYGLLEHYEAIETGLAEEGMLYSSDVLKGLSREFNDHAQLLRDLHLLRAQIREEIEQAIKDEDLPRARVLLTKFKKSEKKQIAKLLSEEDLYHLLPPSAFQKYPALAKKLSKFSAKESFKTYLARHELNKKELAELDSARARREEVQKQKTAVERIRQYLGTKQALRSRLWPKMKSKSKAIQAIKATSHKLGFKPLSAEAKRREEELAKKLKILPKISKAMLPASAR